MTIYIDPPSWPGHGRMWSHLISDVSYDELHAFAARLDVPRRAFERDHYDLPSNRYADAVLAGAVEVASREVVRLLHASGLRRRKQPPSGSAPQRVGVHPRSSPTRVNPDRVTTPCEGMFVLSTFATSSVTPSPASARAASARSASVA